MKHILIVIPSFAIGGTIVSLNSLLSVIDASQYQIDVLPLSPFGAYKNRLPNCNIIQDNLWLATKIEYGSFKTLVSIFLRVLEKLGRTIGFSLLAFYGKCGGKQIESDKYDAVICFSESISDRVCHYPNKNKIAWIHCDYSRYLKITHRTSEKNIYSKFNHVVCVSEYAKLKFVDTYPQFADKTVAIHNIINIDDIRKKANNTELLDRKFNIDDFTIISVGRLDPVKQFSLIPGIADEIRSITNKPFKWYIIGGSRGFKTLENNLIEDIERRGLTDCVIRLGEKQNVYPYIIKADLFVSTSESESFPLVVNEAKALGVWVVANNFASVHESITEGVNGNIVPCNEMPKAIASLLEQTEVAIPNYWNENDLIMEQIISLL